MNPTAVTEQHDALAALVADYAVQHRCPSISWGIVSEGQVVVTGAVGTLDGEAFDVTDYFRLVYNPEHHHFQRHFAVLFDAPIGGACGLAVRDLGSSPDIARVERVDCALGLLDERAISSNVYVP